MLQLTFGQRQLWRLTFVDQVMWNYLFHTKPLSHFRTIIGYILLAKGIQIQIKKIKWRKVSKVLYFLKVHVTYKVNITNKGSNLFKCTKIQKKTLQN